MICSFVSLRSLFEPCRTLLLLLFPFLCPVNSPFSPICHYLFSLFSFFFFTFDSHLILQFIAACAE